MQKFAQSWLVYELSHSATIVGVVVALQAVPMLLVGPYGGVVADRFDKRRIMILLQTVMAILALVLGLLTVTSLVALWHVYVLALVLGICETFENPARQAFVFEMVGPKQLSNAVGLNSVLNNIARAAGPALGAVLVATVGLGLCFLFNAASFAAVIYSLFVIDPSQLQPAVLVPRKRGQLREGLSYVRSSPPLWVPLAMMALVGTFAWEFQTTLPPLAAEVLHGGATAYGAMTAAQGIGAIFGGLAVATFQRFGRRVLVSRALGFGAAMTLLSLSPNLASAVVLMAVVGFFATSLSVTANTTIQLEADPHMRGRVMSLWGVAMQGSTPVGGPLVGYLASAAGARIAVAVGAASCLFAAGLGTLSTRRRQRASNRETAPEPVAVPAKPDAS
jgi:MFS family permease